MESGEFDKGLPPQVQVEMLSNFLNTKLGYTVSLRIFDHQQTSLLINDPTQMFLRGKEYSQGYVIGLMQFNIFTMI